MRSVWTSAWVVLGLLGALGCTTSVPPATDGGAVPTCASLCDGCCDAAGRCHGGASAEACGEGGKLCASCGSSELCAKGVCEVYDCRTTASACGAGTVCEQGSGRCVTACSGNADCHRTGESCTSGQCVCASGTHACGAQCASNTSVQSCGSSCTPCPAPEHATATCDGQRCDFTCAAPFIKCGSGCCMATGSLGAGELHSCMLTSQGGAKCWGDNTYAQLGDGTVANRSRPVDVQSLSGAVTLTLGAYHSCALLADAGVACWGRNNHGQLGDGTLADRNVATPVQGLLAAKSVSAGAWHTCAVTTQGKVMCWGENSYRQLGNLAGSDWNAAFGSRDSKVPVEIDDPTETFTAVAAGGVNTCALTTGNGVTCWGSDSWALVTNLCDGSYSNPVGGCRGSGPDRTKGPTPQPMLASDVFALSVGASSACAVVGTGAAKCWGALPSSSYSTSNTPATVSGLTSASGPTVAAVDPGILGSGCALNSGGQVLCWGVNSPLSTPFGLDGGVIGLATGSNHSCAALADAGVRCWGLNTTGQLGDGTTQPRTVPVDVAF